MKNEWAGMTDKIPLMRAGTPEDVAGSALFLASRAGAYVNGIVNILTLRSGAQMNLCFTAATITLDGGLTSAYPRSRM